MLKMGSIMVHEGHAQSFEKVIEECLLHEDRNGKSGNHYDESVGTEDGDVERGEIMFATGMHLNVL